MTDRILRPAEIRQKLGGISNTCLYDWIKAGKIPKPQPIVPGGRATGLRESVIDAIIAVGQSNRRAA